MGLFVIYRELQKWEARVQEAKKELVGLENVMKLMHSSNLTVKEKLGPIKEGCKSLFECLLKQKRFV